jgi:hypothetical protein
MMSMDEKQRVDEKPGQSEKPHAEEKSTPAESRLPALEPEDFYFEGPNMVFTAAYHLKRGTCCGSGCRHCPYGHVNVGPRNPE